MNSEQFQDSVERRRRGEGVVAIDGKVPPGPCYLGGRGKIETLSSEENGNRVLEPAA